MPRIAFGIFACPIAAVLGNELFESVTGAPRSSPRSRSTSMSSIQARRLATGQRLSGAPRILPADYLAGTGLMARSVAGVQFTR